MASIPRFYQWAGWLLLASGGLAALVSSYFNAQIVQAVAEEATLLEDAGLDAGQLRARIVQLQTQTAQLESVKLTSQVQALNLLTQLGNRHGLTLQIQFQNEKKDLRCLLETKGSEEKIWSFLSTLDALHRRSQGSITLQSYDLSTREGRVELRLKIQMISRTPRGEKA